MRGLYDRIRRAVLEGRVVISIHADDQLIARHVARWQLLESFEDGELIAAYSHAKPNPKILIRQLLPDGMEVVAVWAYIQSADRAILVTAYFEE